MQALGRSTIEIIAHRGAGQNNLQPDTPPENTLPAFAYAWSPEVDADAVELDIRLTRDGEIIAIHDDTTDRTTNARWVVAEHTLAELRSLDAGSWKAHQFAGIRLPTLVEAMEIIPEAKRLFIEIKTGPQIVDRLAQVVRGSGKSAAQLPLISFDIDAIRRAKQKLPEHECYLLVSSESEGLDALIQLVKSAGLDGIDAGLPMPFGLLDRIHDNHLKSVVWTVNDVEVARELIDAGVRSITTDFPRQMRAKLRAALPSQILYP
jgi:glycerophosphoryl diester phosphodiesterase